MVRSAEAIKAPEGTYASMTRLIADPAGSFEATFAEGLVAPGIPEHLKDSPVLEIGDVVVRVRSRRGDLASIHSFAIDGAEKVAMLEASQERLSAGPGKARAIGPLPLSQLLEDIATARSYHPKRKRFRPRL